jgi:hypothetical protein
MTANDDKRRRRAGNGDHEIDPSTARGQSRQTWMKGRLDPAPVVVEIIARTRDGVCDLCGAAKQGHRFWNVAPSREGAALEVCRGERRGAILPGLAPPEQVYARLE